MNTLQCISECPIAVACPVRLCGIGYDGCKLSLTDPSGSSIHTYNMCIEPIGCTSGCRRYSAICYDSCMKCYWAATSAPGGKIYKLDCEYHEIDNITVTVTGRVCGAIVSLCCGIGGELIAAFADAVVEVCKQSGAILRTLCKDTPCVYSGVACCRGYLAVSYTRSGSQFVTLRTHDGKLLVSCCLDNSYQVEDLVTVCTCDHDCNCELYLLASRKGLYPYLLRFCLVCCQPCGKPCDPDHDHDCDHGKPEFPQCCDILESIALVEAALSHILNAEGEKLQKAVASNASVHELLKVNESIVRTIIYATQLEQTLYCKLELALECGCDRPCPPPCPPPCPCNDECHECHACEQCCEPTGSTFPVAENAGEALRSLINLIGDAVSAEFTPPLYELD